MEIGVKTGKFLAFIGRIMRLFRFTGSVQDPIMPSVSIILQSVAMRWVFFVLGGFVLLACGGGGAFSAPSTGGQGGSVGLALEVPDLGAVPAQPSPSALPADWHHGAFMQVYVRGYKDSDGDGRGDLNGLISQLDYLQDLGIRGLWLMPVTQSEDRDHGYAVTNYRAIETDYGSMADFDRLLLEAHKRGMGVVMDYVINHSSSQHPLFKNAASARLNPQRDYYVWQDATPIGWSIFGQNPWYSSGNGYYYAPFWQGMPDFNWKSAPVKAFHHDNLRFWLNKGVDGMRFDAVGMLVENGSAAWSVQPESRMVMQQVQQLMASYGGRYIVCESPDAAQSFGADSACAGAFAFDLKDHILNAARGDVHAIGAVSAYFVSAPPGMATFLANHDGFAGDRIWNQLNGNVAHYQLAAATYLLLPGTPFVYYGEEIGMANGSGLSGDWALRSPMSWTATTAGFSSGTVFRAASSNMATHNVHAQVGVAGSLHGFYKALIGLRNALPSIAQGGYLYPSVSGAAMAFQRRWGDERSLVVINYGTAAQAVSLGDLGAGAVWQPRLGAVSAFTADAAGGARPVVPAQSVSVFVRAP
jgi:alpha-amylase